jgi:hypothetical protein
VFFSSGRFDTKFAYPNNFENNDFENKSSGAHFQHPRSIASVDILIFFVASDTQ